MDMSILTIDNLFAAPAAMAPPAPKADARKAENAFSPVVNDGTAQVDSSRAEGTDNVPTDVAGTSGSKPAREFRHLLREKTEGQSPPKNQKAGESKQPASVEDCAAPQKPARTPLAENVAPVLRDLDASAAAVKSKAVSKLANLTTGLKPEKSAPLTGHAAKSAQIKTLAATGEKGQLGLKTVLPPKSNGLNGLKAVPPDSSTSLSSAKGQPGEKARTDKTQPDEKVADAKTLGKSETVKELVREAPDDGGKVVDANKKLQGAGMSAKGDVTSPPARSVKKDMMPEVLADGDGKKTNADGKKARGMEQMSAKEVHVSDSQPGDRGRSATNHGPTQNFEQILAHSNPQSATASQSAAASAKGANSPGQSPPGDASADIGRQILESIQNSASQQGAERQVTVRLNPPELGQVFIKLQEQNTELTGVLEVSRSQTRFEIEQALPEIIRNLADCGIHVRRLDVMLSEQGRPEQGAFGGQSMQNNSPGGHDPADQGAWADEPDFSVMNEWSPNNNVYHDFFEQQEAFVTNDSINMLI